jgi:hypothetical protein
MISVTAQVLLAVRDDWISMILRPGQWPNRLGSYETGFRIHRPGGFRLSFGEREWVRRSGGRTSIQGPTLERGELPSNCRDNP